MDDSPILVYVTCPDPGTAERIGAVLVEERLAACVNILPGMRAVYRWQGAVERADEAVLLVKTLRGRAAAVAVRVRALHPYREPCVLELPITGGSPSYLAWLAEGSR